MIKHRIPPRSISRRSLAVCLAVPESRIRLLIKQYGLPLRKTNSVRGYVHFQDLVELARKKPELFGGIDRNRLEQVLGDRQLAAHCASFPKPINRHAIAVKCVETGEVFRSQKEAGQRMHITQQAIGVAIRKGWESAGYHWEKVNN